MWRAPQIPVKSSSSIIWCWKDQVGVRLPPRSVSHNSQLQQQLGCARSQRHSQGCTHPPHPRSQYHICSCKHLFPAHPLSPEHIKATAWKPRWKGSTSANCDSGDSKQCEVITPKGIFMALKLMGKRICEFFFELFSLFNRSFWKV